MRVRKIVAFGLGWGVLQTVLFVSFAFLSFFGINSVFDHEYRRSMLQLVVLTSLTIPIIVGYVFLDIGRSIITLLLVQLVGFLSFMLLAFLYGLELTNFLVLNLFGFSVLIFIGGTVGSAFGVFLGDRFTPSRTMLVGWKFLCAGYLIACVAAVLSLYPYRYNNSPVALWDSTIPVIPVIAALVLTGSVLMINGFRRKAELRSERVGLIVIIGLLVSGLSLISTGFAYGASSIYGYCSNSCPDFQIIGGILASSLLISFGGVIASLFSDQKEGVTELLARGSAPMSDSWRPA